MLQGYLRALGMTRTAQVKRDARNGEAEARRDAGIRVIYTFQASYVVGVGRGPVMDNQSVSHMTTAGHVTPNNESFFRQV